MIASEKNALHLSEGEDKPEVAGKRRLYNMHFCPFSQRVRSVLKAKRVEVEKININLREKPEWYYEITPLGKVPALQEDNRALVESMVICEYLNDAYPDPPLYPDDPWLKAVDRSWIESFAGKVVSPFHKIFNNPQNSEEVELIAQNVNNGLDLFEKELDNRGTTFFYGDSPGMLDLALFPWFERFKIAQKIFPDLVILSESRFPKMTKYVEVMNKVEVVASSSPDFEDHLKFIKSHLEGDPNFDIGI